MTSCVSVVHRNRSAKRGACAVTVAVLLLAGLLLLPAQARAQTSTFLDLPSGGFGAAIEAVVGAGIMEGCAGDTFFCPTDPVTREDMAVWLERAIHGSGYVPPAATGIFQDVPASYCLAPWIEEFKNEGLTAGCSATPLLYCPYRPLTRAEMAIFLLGAEHGSGYSPPDWCGPPNYNTPTFDDVPCSSWAIDWIEQFHKEGITAGCSANPPLFCPNAGVTREQMAAFMKKIWLP